MYVLWGNAEEDGGSSRAAALLRELLDSMTPVEARDRAMAEIGGVAVAEEGGFN